MPSPAGRAVSGTAMHSPTSSSNGRRICVSLNGDCLGVSSSRDEGGIAGRTQHRASKVSQLNGWSLVCLIRFRHVVGLSFAQPNKEKNGDQDREHYQRYRVLIQGIRVVLV